MTADAGERKTLYLIDGHAQFYRAYHAIRTAMSSPVTLEPTNMSFGFVGMIIKLLKDYRPDYLAVVIDVAGDRESFRSEIYPEYKANREAAPDDFRPQVERCLAVLEQMNIPVLGEPGVEADDVIATLVRRLEAEHPELDIRIVSKDKDLAQLLSEHVELFDVHKDLAVTAEDLFKTEGVRPEHVRDILALMGDNVDNIPGVKGIGPKTAAKLILKYGSLQGVLDHLEELKGKQKENIEAAREQLPMNIQLVALREDLDVDLPLESAAVDVAAMPAESLVATMRELGFNRHRDEFQELLGGGGGDEPAPAEAGSLFASLDTPAPPPVDRGDARLAETAAHLEELATAIRRAGRCALAVVTDEALPMRAVLLGLAIAVEPRRGWYVPMSLDGAMATLGPLLSDPGVAKVGHDLKEDTIVLRRHGVAIAGLDFDAMVASYVIDATRSGHALDVLALSELKYTCIPRADLVGKGRDRRSMTALSAETILPWAAEQADLPLRLEQAFIPRLEAAELDGLFRDVEMPLVEVLADLEYTGIHVDRAELERQRGVLAGRIDSLRERIGADAPHPFNPDSPKQLAVALFNKPDEDPPGLGLPVQKRGKTGPSTDVEVLEKLAADERVDSPIPALIVEYRQLTKLVNTYLIALGEAIHPETGRIHASFNQTVAATGRLSSSDPNLQNIPVRTEVGREIRRAFRAGSGCVLLTADYSQIELRLLAHLSEDPALTEAFRTGADIHTAVAAEVFGVDPDAVTSEQRGSAKMVNFGIIYGITPFGLARRLGPGVSREAAAAIIADYKARFTRIDTFLAECVETAKSRGYVQTILGRRRNIPQAAARHPVQRALGERMAINTVVQGSAADLIKLAMIDLHRRLPEAFPDARMILQIHDELVFETPASGVESLRGFVVERMRSAMELRVELVVDSAWSECWVDA